MCKSSDKIINLTERLTRTYESYRVLLAVSDPNDSRVLSISSGLKKIPQNRIIPVNRKPPHNARLLKLIFSNSFKSWDIILEETGRKESWW